MKRAQSNEKTSSFDILIVGAGPVGLSLAVALARSISGISIAIVDRRMPSPPKDMRASAIAAGAVRLFDTIGVWADMAPQANPIVAMKITDSGQGDISRPVLLRFDGEAAPGEPFAQMVPNRASGPALLNAAQDAGIDFIAPVQIVGFEADGAKAKLLLADGKHLCADLVVAADGGRSALRGYAGIDTFNLDYGQSGLVTTIGHTLNHENVAYEHFRPAGPFASLPLKGGKQSSLVWSESTERAKALGEMAHGALAAEIESVMGASLGHVTIEDEVQVFPLTLRIAKRFAAPRLALIGDAAHVIHPIAGQGLNLGLKDVAALAEMVVDAVRLGRDIGSSDVLERYDWARRFDAALMALATDGLNRMFSNDLAPVRALRDFGLSTVDRIDGLKSAFIGHAAGTQGAKLLKGIAL
ncbi:FAD-dependent monooxygenase [Pelagibacterium lentulum]|uniref:2-octaprenyl-6-methoxyphenyl hydroxylase n=1 Tax=Pelagibacterium lentulum TaxID=2029865 RepID=A0A916VTZ2_9HYPH|nr:FAD-dependent monooxygenase [Pelagibacterium lentulum]GGA37230.1 2-octaprenyl-6-methoxyphenyl hydroxylase [Pelagibacterium lentulum]